MEPDYIRQSAEAMLPHEIQTWFLACEAEARGSGCTAIRRSSTLFPATNATLKLVEGWKSVPLDMGEPRWQLQAAKA